MDFSAIFKLKGMWNRFCGNHPKFEPFLRAARDSLNEGSVIEISITRPDGRVIESNLKLTEADMALWQELKGFSASQNR